MRTGGERAQPVRRRLAMVLASLLLGGLGLAAVVVVSGNGTLGQESSSVATTHPTAPRQPGRPPAASPSPTPPADAELTILAAGDVLLHEPVIYSARTDTGYDFAGLLAPIEEWVSGADLALCHLEVPITAEGERFSGYPLFGAPVDIAESLAENGWDGCSTASNHSLDRGFPGLVRTLDAFDEAGLGHVGTARTDDESTAPQVYLLEREGRQIRIAHLAATYGTNGLPLPPDAPWAVTLISVDDLIAQARLARAAGADLVVASLHCCVEYVTEPTPEQWETARALADSGEVDLLLGHHAHVAQPVVRLDGGPGGAGMWAAMGMGNLLSNQDASCCAPGTESGLLITATVRAPADGPATVTGVEWTGVTVDRRAGHLVHPLVRPDEPVGSLSAEDATVRHRRLADAAGPAAPERTHPPRPTGPRPTALPRPAQPPTTGSD